MCWRAIPSAASTYSPSPPATPTRSPEWCWWTPPHRHRRRSRRRHRPATGGSYDVMGRVSALVSSSARLGLTRLYSHVAFGSLPPQSRDEVSASIATASNLRSTIDEFVQANASMRQAAALRDFGDKPLVVLTAGS